MALCFFNTRSALCQPKDWLPKKIVFEVKTEFDSTGIKNMEVFMNSIREVLFPNYKDSLSQLPKSLTSDFITEYINKTQNIVIETSGDTIYKYNYNDGEIAKDYQRIAPDGKVYIYHKTDRNAPFDTTDYANKGTYAISYEPSDTKNIMGYLCYKVNVLEKGLEDRTTFSLFLMGDMIYEMYITPSIKLPLHAVSFYSKEFQGFPLEIKSWNKKLPGVFFNYTVKSIQW
jgi:hypothetical protein